MKYFTVTCLLLLFSSCGGDSGETLGDQVPAVTSYYIDSSAASNGSGTKSSPFNTFSGITLEEGAQYLIKRGTVLYEQITVNASGTSGSPITIGSYGNGALPVIDGSGEVAASSWEDEGGGVYSNTLSPTASVGRGNVMIDGTLQNHVDTAVPGLGEYTIETSGKVQIYGNPSGKLIRLSRRYYGIHGVGVSFIVIENVHIRQVSLHGIQFENSHNITIRNCTIEACGGAFVNISPSIQAGNGIEFGNASSHCSVSGCTVRDIFDSGISPQTYDNTQAASDFSFSGNTVSKCGFAGFEIAVLSNSGTTGSSISDVSIDNNEVLDSGKGFSGMRYSEEGRGIKIMADSGAGSISGITVSRCKIKNSAGEGIFISGDTGTVKVDRCLLQENIRGGLLFQQTQTVDAKLVMSSSIIRENGDASHSGVSISTSANTGGFEFYHNTFYDNGQYGLLINGGVFSKSLLKNNLFHQSVYNSFGLVLISPLKLEAVENNWFTEFPGLGVIAYPVPTSFNTATDFNDSGTEVSGSMGGSNPGLDDSLDILSTSSPCYHAGVSGTGIKTDYSGKTFDSDSPSVGAYEY